jgi:hypothetical protein
VDRLDYWKRLLDYVQIKRLSVTGDDWWNRLPVELAESRVAMAKGLGQGKRPPLEAVTRGPMKRQKAEKTQCVL